MFQIQFEGKYYSYSHEPETNEYMLFYSEEKNPVLLKDFDAEMFHNHLLHVNGQQDDTLSERTERTIQIHYLFMTRPYPMPRFVEA